MKVEKFIDSLRSTKREGIDNLIKVMDEGGFFTAPCSGAYHLCHEGGLLEHSLNVHNKAMELARLWLDDSLSEKEKLEFLNSVRICSLLHDLGKMGDHGKSNYVPNMVRSKKKNPETGEYDLVQSEAKPYETNKELTYEEHEIRSLLIAERYIHLTEEEETAILHHNGLYGKLDSSFGNANFCKTKLSFIIHTADMYCSRFVEVNNEES